MTTDQSVSDLQSVCRLQQILLRTIILNCLVVEMFSICEYHDMLLIYREARRNYVRAERSQKNVF